MVRRLTPEQERNIAQRAIAGEPYDALIKDLAAQGVRYTKPAITQLVQRVKRRAAAEPPTRHADPQTGIEVDITDELILGQVTRGLTREFNAKGRSLEDKISIAHVLPKLAAVRHRIRIPAPGPQPTGPAKPAPEQPGQPAEPPRLSPEELEARAWEGLN